jgi:hypothetical protein
MEGIKGITGDYLMPFEPWISVKQFGSFPLIFGDDDIVGDATGL